MSLLPFEIPPGMRASASRGPDAAAFVDRLPRLVRDLAEEWSLTFDGEPRHGSSALVVPVRTTSGRPAALKVDRPHDEAAHEALALQAWKGVPTVQLLRADPHRWAMLLERLHPDEDLRDLWDVEACELVAGSYASLHVPALPQLRSLSSYVARWADALAVLPTDAPVPRRLVEQAVSLGRSFASDPATDAVVVHGDLHYAHVLAGDRLPWVVISPEPMAGDPCYEPAPLLWHRWDEVVASHDVRDAVRRRFHATIDAAGLDEDRARDWVVVRALHEVLRTIEDARRPGVETRDRVTRLVTIAKAVQG